MRAVKGHTLLPRCLIHRFRLLFYGSIPQCSLWDAWTSWTSLRLKRLLAFMIFDYFCPRKPGGGILSAKNVVCTPRIFQYYVVSPPWGYWIIIFDLLRFFQKNIISLFAIYQISSSVLPLFCPSLHRRSPMGDQHGESTANFIAPHPACSTKKQMLFFLVRKIALLRLGWAVKKRGAVTVEEIRLHLRLCRK